MHLYGELGEIIKGPWSQQFINYTPNSTCIAFDTSFVSQGWSEVKKIFDPATLVPWGILCILALLDSFQVSVSLCLQPMRGEQNKGPSPKVLGDKG